MSNKTTVTYAPNYKVNLVPCGRVLGHGERCTTGYLCGSCEEILKLKAELEVMSHPPTGTAARIREDLEIADKKALKWLESFALPTNSCDHPQNKQTVIEFDAVNGGEFGTRVRIIQCLRCRTIKSGDAPWPNLKA